MRRPLRLVDGAERAVDLQIDPTPSATVGELADLLAERTGNPRGMTLVSRWPVDERDAPPPREGLLRSAGPRAGSTVVLVAEADDRRDVGAVARPPRRPRRAGASPGLRHDPAR